MFKLWSPFCALCLSLSAARAVALGATRFREFPMGSIRSRGWIDNELQASLSALGGQLQNFYPLIADGTYTGGKVTYSNLNEAQPYYWSAAVAAVATTSHPELQSWVESTIKFVIQHQDADGWFGPKPRIAWTTWLFLSGAVHYCEAWPNNCPPVLDAMYKYAKNFHTLMKSGDLNKANFDSAWSGVRTATYVQVLQWLYDYHPRDDETQAMLKEDMTLVSTLGDKRPNLYNQSDWERFFRDKIAEDGYGDLNQRTHGVNVAMALKDLPLKWRTTGDVKYKAAARQAWDNVYKYHGKAAGHFAADEHLAGQNPSRGAETCLVVETMWSSSITYAIFGETVDADRAERMAFNSLPAAMTSDWWGRQYLQEEIQVNSMTFSPEYPYRTDGKESNVFGLETNYPCCTVNHQQGLPRFISRAFLRGEATSEADVIHAYLIPSRLTAVLRQNNAVTITVDTNYPFEEKVRYSIEAAKPFVLGLRIPGWTTVAQVSLNGGPFKAVQPVGGVHSLHIPAGKASVALLVPSKIVAQATPGGRGPRNVAVFKGPVMFAVSFNYTLREVRRNGKQPKAVTYDRVRTDPEGYLVAIDTRNMQVVDRRDAASGRPLASPIFDEKSAPLSVRVHACRTSPGTYRVVNGDQWIDNFPPANATCVGSSHEVQLLPYASAKLRLGTMATLDNTDLVGGQLKPHG